MLKVYQMFCAIWYHLYNFKNVKNTDGRMSRLVKLQLCITKINAPQWVFLIFLINISNSFFSHFFFTQFFGSY